ncbi:MAG: dihydrodipicolinate synthase family protein [Pseudonocardia sp.]|jgi:4-hydroxy-tetrahydrodipicolinate synthase
MAQPTRLGSEAKAWARENLTDFFTCPVTPFTEDYQLDVPGLRYNVDALVDMGCSGLVMGGFLAEGWNMTLDEWKRYHEVTYDAVAGRLPLFSIILDYSPAQAVEKLKFLESVGYLGAEVMNPPVQLKTDDDVVTYFEYICQATDLAIVLYRTPVSGFVYSHAAVDRIADIPTVCGMKNGTLSWSDSLGLRRLVGDRMVISEPMERTWVYDLAHHGGQVIFGELSLMLYGKVRDTIHQYAQLARDGDLTKAIALSETLNPARDIYERVLMGQIVKSTSYASSITYLKAWFELVGLKAGPVRPPIPARLPAAELDEMQGQLADAGVI